MAPRYTSLSLVWSYRAAFLVGVGQPSVLFLGGRCGGLCLVKVYSRAFAPFLKVDTYTGLEILLLASLHVLICDCFDLFILNMLSLIWIE